MLHVRQALLLKMALKFSYKLTERLYLSNGFRDGVVSSSPVYSEAPLILSSFCEGRAQQTNYTADPLTALPVVDMVTNVTYANTYCVMCHKTSHDLHMWSLWMESMKVSHREFTLDDIKSLHVRWKAVPVGTVPDKCLLTPPEAKTAPDKKDKRLCRSYANCISVKKDKLITKRKELFKNPHCSL